MLNSHDTVSAEKFGSCEETVKFVPEIRASVGKGPARCRPGRGGKPYITHDFAIRAVGVESCVSVTQP